MINKKVTFKYFLAISISVIITWVVHEYAHWLTANLLGYKSIMKINGISYVDGESPTERHQMLVSASGPLITLLQGLVVFLFLAYQRWNKYVYPFLFIAFYMRFLAGLMNFNNLNDEGRISEFLGIGTLTLSIVVSGLLFYLVYNISKKHHLNWKFQALTTLFVMFTSSVLILSDMFFGIRII